MSFGLAYPLLSNSDERQFHLLSESHHQLQPGRDEWKN